jgi:hypothetical protein
MSCYNLTSNRRWYHKRGSGNEEGVSRFKFPAYTVTTPQNYKFQTYKGNIFYRKRKRERKEKMKIATQQQNIKNCYMKAKKKTS